jgi:hypothetical protein
VFALRDIVADDQHMGFTVDFDDVGGLQQRVNGAPPAAKLALDIAQRTFAPEIRQELRTVIEIDPYPQLL